MASCNKKSIYEEDDEDTTAKWTDPTIAKIKCTVQEVQGHLSRVKTRYEDVAKQLKEIDSLDEKAGQKNKQELQNTAKSILALKTSKVQEKGIKSAKSPKRSKKVRVRSLGSSRRLTTSKPKERTLKPWSCDPRRLAAEKFLLRHEKNEEESKETDLKSPRNSRPTVGKRQSRPSLVKADAKNPGWWAMAVSGYDVTGRSPERNPDVSKRPVASYNLYDTWASTGYHVTRGQETTPKAFPPQRKTSPELLAELCVAVSTTAISDSSEKSVRPGDPKGDINMFSEGLRSPRKGYRPKTNSAGYWFHNRDAISQRLEERRMCISPNNLTLPEVGSSIGFSAESMSSSSRLPSASRAWDRSSSSAGVSAVSRGVASSDVSCGLGIFGVEIEGVWNTHYRYSFARV